MYADTPWWQKLVRDSWSVQTAIVKLHIQIPFQTSETTNTICANLLVSDGSLTHVFIPIPSRRTSEYFFVRLNAVMLVDPTYFSMFVILDIDISPATVSHCWKSVRVRLISGNGLVKFRLRYLFRRCCVIVWEIASWSYVNRTFFVIPLSSCILPRYLCLVQWTVLLLRFTSFLDSEFCIVWLVCLEYANALGSLDHSAHVLILHNDGADPNVFLSVIKGVFQVEYSSFFFLFIWRVF